MNNQKTRKNLGGIEVLSQGNIQNEENCYEDMTGKIVTIKVDPELGKVNFQGLGSGVTLSYDTQKDYNFAINSFGK